MVGLLLRVGADLPAWGVGGSRFGVFPARVLVRLFLGRFFLYSGKRASEPLP